MTHCYHPFKNAGLLLCLLVCSGSLLAQAKMIWSDNSGKISRANTDGSNIEVFLARHIPEDMVADTATQTIYWSESGTNTIWRIGLNGGEPVMVHKAGDKIHGLALDQGKLYVAGAAAIFKMNLDGSQVATALAVSNARDLAVVDGQLYWTGVSDGTVWKQNAAGTGGTALFTGLSSPQNLQYNAADQKLYWMEYCGASVCSGIRKGNPNGTGKTVVINEFVGGFDFNATGTRLYCSYDIFDEIFSINTNGSGRTSEADITSTPTDVLLLGGRLLWFDLAYGDYLYSANPTGSDEQVLAATPVYRPARFVVDSVGKWIYWINAHGSFQADKSQAIKKSRLDGSELQSVVPKNELSDPYGLGIDLTNQQLYWTDAGKDAIRRSKLDGTNVEDVLTGLSIPRDLIVDAAHNRIFWSDWGVAKIMRANLDGSQPTVIADNLGIPWGIALDPVEDYVYWGDIGSHIMLRGPASGGQVDTIITFPTVFERPIGLAIDPIARKLYWSDEARRSIYRSELDGSNIDTLLVAADGLDQPAGIQIFGAGSVVPVQAPAAFVARSVYPNPCASAFIIDGAEAGDRLTVYDALGRLVLAQTVTQNGLFPVTCAAWNDGLYVLTIRQTDGQTTVRKIVKRAGN